MHPSRKVNTPRLIMAISIVDQLVERFVFEEFSRTEKDNYPLNANMVGFGRSLSHDRMITQKVKTTSERTGLPPTASDVSGWERRVAPSSLDEVAYIIHYNAQGPEDERAGFLHFALIWAAVSARPTYVVGSKLYNSKNHGMMPSGTFMTSYGNGLMRILFSVCAGAEAVVVLGDDCLEWNKDPKAMQELYNAWGLVTREVETFELGGRKFTFCSKYYDSTDESNPLVVPQSWGKILATYSNLKRRTPAHFSALSKELHGLPRGLYDEIISWAKLCPFALPLGVEQDVGSENPT